MISILIVDDHPAIGEGTKMILEQEPDIHAYVITEPIEIIDLLEEKRFDIYLIDLYMPNLNGIELTKIILKIDPDATILIYTGYDLVSHFNLLIEIGVVGFLSKAANSEQLVTAIRCALRDEVVIPLQLIKQLRRIDAGPTCNFDHENLSDIILSSKQQQILEGIAEGYTNKAIAVNLSMSQRTIEYNLTKIFLKLGVNSRTEALVKAKEFGLLSEKSLLNNSVKL